MTQKQLIDWCTARDINLPCAGCELGDACDAYMRKTKERPYLGQIYDPELYTDEQIEGYEE